MAQKLIEYLKYFIFFVLVIGILYFNFRANNNSAQYISAEFLKQCGFDPSMIKTIKSMSDKMAHFMVGFLLSLSLMSVSIFTSMFSRIFVKNTLNVNVSVFFMVIFLLLEFSQWSYRTLVCGVGAEYICENVYFSWLDVAAGFIGASIAIGIVLFVEFIKSLRDYSR